MRTTRERQERNHTIWSIDRLPSRHFCLVSVRASAPISAPLWRLSKTTAPIISCTRSWVAFLSAHAKRAVYIILRKRRVGLWYWNLTTNLASQILPAKEICGVLFQEFEMRMKISWK
jgi:hypothetical protein